MTRRHQLEITLRCLRLPGMLDTLEARLAQAQAGELRHVEFLQVLCEDEIARRDAAAVDRRIWAARFETPATIEHFDFAYNPKIPAATIRDLATLRFVDTGTSAILHGPVGVGKTHIAQALAHRACRRRHSAAFTKTSRLLADLAGGHADRTWGTRLRRWAKPAVLVLDDFSMRDWPPARRPPPSSGSCYQVRSSRATPARKVPVGAQLQSPPDRPSPSRCDSHEAATAGVGLTGLAGSPCVRPGWISKCRWGDVPRALPEVPT